MLLELTTKLILPSLLCTTFFHLNWKDETYLTKCRLLIPSPKTPKSLKSKAPVDVMYLIIEICLSLINHIIREGIATELGQGEASS